ncbi:LOW QUALITY PROTEIN: hypothetical protein HID58_079297 [Brassica napus]|uniref:Uncharacterized protein n=1 Tax=Brassica napus TaxID=3708 RepID=A0ABQ7Y1R7_BRANA|nr:LOW QUALITY PROTEIN: hypothetical protein HID58_079297 [Brassica napus]
MLTITSNSYVYDYTKTSNFVMMNFAIYLLGFEHDKKILMEIRYYNNKMNNEDRWEVLENSTEEVTTYVEPMSPLSRRDSGFIALSPLCDHYNNQMRIDSPTTCSDEEIIESLYQNLFSIVLCLQLEESGNDGSNTHLSPPCPGAPLKLTSFGLDEQETASDKPAARPTRIRARPDLSYILLLVILSCKAPSSEDSDRQSPSLARADCVSANSLSRFLRIPTAPSRSPPSAKTLASDIASDTRNLHNFFSRQLLRPLNAKLSRLHADYLSAYSIFINASDLHQRHRLVLATRDLENHEEVSFFFCVHVANIDLGERERVKLSCPSDNSIIPETGFFHLLSSITLAPILSPSAMLVPPPATRELTAWIASRFPLSDMSLRGNSRRAPEEKAITESLSLRSFHATTHIKNRDEIQRRTCCWSIITRSLRGLEMNQNSEIDASNRLLNRGDLWEKFNLQSLMFSSNTRRLTHCYSMRLIIFKTGLNRKGRGRDNTVINKQRDLFPLGSTQRADPVAVFHVGGDATEVERMRRERTLEKGRPEEEVERGGGGDEGSGEFFGFSILLRVDEIKGEFRWIKLEKEGRKKRLPKEEESELFNFIRLLKRV